MTKHLTAQQRYEISFRLQNKERPTDIARALGVHRSTISREIRRNKAPREPIVSAGRHCEGRQWHTGGCIACSGRTENEESALTTETMLETIPMKHA